ncbi:MAG: hypothetical protein JWN11_1308 [Hyphomicrobiales bacterium]|nr:hypothetical protein [Hyphomicrobiales bacterium]
MNNAHTLTSHRDIQKWISTNKGMPAISKVRDRLGMERARLAISFASARAKPTGMPTQDDGMSPVSWSAWLAELDRQHLALRVLNQQDPAFEFVERQGLEERMN